MQIKCIKIKAEYLLPLKSTSRGFKHFCCHVNRIFDIILIYSRDDTCKLPRKWKENNDAVTTTIIVVKNR